MLITYYALQTIVPLTRSCTSKLYLLCEQLLILTSRFHLEAQCQVGVQWMLRPKAYLRDTAVKDVQGTG